ncbi:MAG: conjugal transfer protein TraD, partial [Rhizobacter sp.]|nr:conjugal transfer protein TraD [Rhizobacter sp.]
MLVRPYEMPWRPAYEAWAAAAWLLGLLYFVYITGSQALFTPFALTLAAFAMLMMIVRARQATQVLTVRASLSGRAMQVITTRRLGQLTPDPGMVFLGFGFE